MKSRFVTTTAGALVLATILAVAALAPGAAGQGGGSPAAPELGGGTWVIAVTEKAGALGFLGHRHSVEVTDWTAEVGWNPDDPAASRAVFTVPASSLRIDTARSRKLAGLDGGPGKDDVAELQEKMLSAENLDAAGHPELRLAVTKVERRSASELRVTGRLTIKGKTRPVRFPVKVERSGSGAVFSGAFTVKHTDFGIEPESIAGVVKVADPVEIRFRVEV
jgi:polyisoprenoid-binding protein YceI